MYRVELFRSAGLAIWDEHWYAGHHLPGYSLLFPPLGALLGVRLLGALSVLLSTALFAAADALGVRRAGGAMGRGVVRGGGGGRRVGGARRVRAGRVARAGARRSRCAAGMTALACALAAAVRGGEPGGGRAARPGGADGGRVDGARVREALALAAPPALVVLSLAALFPEGG